MLAHLGRKADGTWLLWVALPGLASNRQPSTTLGTGDGPSVAVRTAALAGLGFEPARPGQAWSWEEVEPGRCVELVGTMPVGAVSVASPPAPRQGGAGARVPRKAAAPKRAAAAARPAPEPAARRTTASRTAPERRAAAAPPARPVLDAPPRAGLALPAGSSARTPAVTGSRSRPAALPPGETRRPAAREAAALELGPARPLALPAAAPRVPNVLDQLLSPRVEEGHTR
ncbi:DUF6303 family protein [Streptomyces sp. NPDC059708]|uniref:DUF6303 family protein n=1 Tax=Streptomyces sp. NPDC059708 TaxID=3346916 RepID=UPI0036C54AFA